MEAKICEKTIAYGNQRYRTDGTSWLALHYGTYSPKCNGIPSYRWMRISPDKVPAEVKLKG